MVTKLIDFDHYRVEDLPELSDEDKKKPYASYYSRGRLTPPPHLLAAIQPGNPIDPARAVMPENLSILLDPDTPDPLPGYCALPNGGAYACMVIKMPGVTMEMINWWMPWVLGDHMRYKIWHPGSHAEHYLGLAVEDIGDGMADLYLGNVYSFKDLGLPDDPAAFNPKILAINRCRAQCHLHSQPEDAPKSNFTMIHVVRKIEGGLEYWSFFWSGIHIENGRAVLKINPGEVITAENGRHFASHLAHEYTTLAAILPELYAQYKNDPVIPPPPWPERVR